MKKRLTFAALILAFALTAGSAEPKVVLNTSTLKYHCASCKWAKECTKNCVKLDKSEAIERGGKACKVCGGTCK